MLQIKLRLKPNNVFCESESALIRGFGYGRRHEGHPSRSSVIDNRFVI